MHALLQRDRRRILAVRLGATDLCALYGLRRSPDLSIYDVKVISGLIADVVNVLSRADGTGFTVTGPVWEYFGGAERIFRTQLRESPFAEHNAPELRGQLVSRAIDGLIREVQLDRANGLEGKTAIHPSHVAVINALSVVSFEEHRDATDVLHAGRASGVLASGHRNKMNEIRPHTAWARRTLLRSRVFGVAAETRLVRRPARGEPVPVTVADETTASVVERLGVRVDGDAAALLGLALRRNPRRAQLLVSRVLGKHVPTDPRLVRAAGLLLGGLVADVLAGRSARGAAGRAAARGGGRGPGRRGRLHRVAADAVEPVPRDALVLGFAETATALGHCVAEGLGGADYLHSTRRQHPAADRGRVHRGPLARHRAPAGAGRPGAAARRPAAGAGRRRAEHRPHRAEHDHRAAPARAAGALRGRRPGRRPARRRRAGGRGRGARRPAGRGRAGPRPGHAPARPPRPRRRPHAPPTRRTSEPKRSSRAPRTALRSQCSRCRSRSETGVRAGGAARAGVAGRGAGRRAARVHGRRPRRRWPRRCPGWPPGSGCVPRNAPWCWAPRS